MKFPVTIQKRRAVAKIYGRSYGYKCYRVAYQLGTHRVLRSSSTFKKAREFAESAV